MKKFESSVYNNNKQAVTRDGDFFIKNFAT